MLVPQQRQARTDTPTTEVGLQTVQTCPTDQATGGDACACYIAYILRHRRSERIPGHAKNLRHGRRAGGSNEATLVGMTGFEPATFRSQSGRATNLRHIP